MLSHDEIHDGMPFILQLPDAAGKQVWWLETLKGEDARRWYETYRRSDWATLRQEAGGTFHNRVTQAEAERARTTRRCVVIKTGAVNETEIRPAGDAVAQGVT